MVGNGDQIVRPAGSRAERIVPGIWAIAVPIPGPLRVVLVYALELFDGLLLVDAGWDGDDQYDALARGLSTIGAAPDDVTGILVTHAHGDHYSLAMRIREASDCWIGLHPADVAYLEQMAASAGAADHPIESWGRRWAALPDERAAAIATMDRAFSAGFELAPDVLLDDGRIVEAGARRLQIVHTPGHTPGHVCVVESAERVVFVGDHVLEGGRPNVSIGPGSADDPLADHIEALRRMLPYEDYEALPGHGRSFGLSRGLAATREAHAAQLRTARRLVSAGASTVREVASALPADRAFEKLGSAGKYLLLGETHAYLAALERDGAIEAVDDWPLRWRAARNASD
jgi:glyoxylase-like metal-dependent hydrolase (beta-lactamase superfamily II)